MSVKRKISTSLFVVTLLLAALFLGSTLTGATQHTHQLTAELQHEHHNHGPTDSIVFHDVDGQSREFIKYYYEIKLNDEQKEVKNQALNALKAVCCDDFPMSDCCCECNLSRTIWGLSNHLIANLSYDQEQVRDTVQRWLEFVNPDGFSGQACYEKRCLAPFDEDGCGGMDPKQLITSE